MVASCMAVDDMVSGQLDIRRDEDLLYAQRFRLAGVTVEFHLRPGVPNSLRFSTLVLASPVARSPTTSECYSESSVVAVHNMPRFPVRSRQ